MKVENTCGIAWNNIRIMIKNTSSHHSDDAGESKKRRCYGNPNSIFDNVSPINEKDQGVQGAVFKCIWKNKAAIMKVSNHIDFVLELEEEAWSRLKNLNCIHFCEVLEKIPIKPGERRYCLFYKEILNNNRNDSLANLIYNEAHHPNALLNCVRQTLAAIVMFEELGITHYDLHADNTMVADAEYDVHVYKFGDRIVPIRTYGITPVIIDFGMAYIPNTRYKTTCVFAKEGYTTFMSDPIVDSRLLLMTAINDLKDLSKGLKSYTRRMFNAQYKDTCTVVDKFIKKTELIFTPLKLESTGWYKTENMFPNIVEELINQLPCKLKTSDHGIFKPDNIDWIIELLQYEITIPITQSKPNTPSFGKATCMLAINWKKLVEPVIRNTREEQLFFKDLVSIPHDADISVYINMRHRYPKIKNIKELKRCVKIMGDALNNFLYEKMVKVQSIKDALYAKLPYRTTLDILHTLPSVPNKYVEGMTIIVMDPTSPNHKEMVIDDTLANMLNKNEQETFKKILC